jgi:hypothetical protein
MMFRSRRNCSPRFPLISPIPATLAIFALVFVVLTPAARAATLARMSLAQMSRAAPVIVRAECLENSAAWDAEEIWTFTSFAVQEAWRGAPPPRIVVRLLGGTIDDLTSSVSGIPRFRPGEEVILFLEPTRAGDFSIVSWMQGTFRIRHDPRTGEETVTQDTASFATFDPATRRFEPSGVRDMPIISFRAHVDAALRAAPLRKP